MAAGLHWAGLGSRQQQRREDGGPAVRVDKKGPSISSPTPRVARGALDCHCPSSMSSSASTTGGALRSGSSSAARNRHSLDTGLMM